MIAWFNKKKAKAMAKIEEKLKAESEVKQKAEKRLRAEIDARASAERQVKAEAEKMLLTQYRRYSVLAERAEAQAKEAIAAAEAKAEEKIRSYAAALAQAEEKLAKVEEKLAKAKEKTKTEVQPTETIKTFKRICRYLFHPNVTKRKFALFSALAILSVIALAFGVSMVNDPPVANDDTATTQEDTPLVAIDVLANDTDIDNVGRYIYLETFSVTAVSQGTNGSVTINPDSTLAYSPHANFYGNDVFTYTISDDKGRTDTARVNVTVNIVNDAPEITSTPVTTATAGALYTYDVDAADPDVADTLTYSLTTKPADMTIHSATGLIQLKPTNAQVGANEVVVVKVVDSNSIPALDTQSFTITVNPAPPKIAKLTVLDGYNQRNRKTLSADGKTNLVQSSDNDRWGINFGSYISYDFTDLSFPADAAITSVVVFVEHFEEERFAQGKLEWAIGTGWPAKPVVWASINAPVHEGQSHEAIDSWDVTSVMDTREKINSLQLQVKNNDNVANRKTLIDYTYVVVEWD